MIDETTSFGRELERYVVVSWLREQSSVAKRKEDRNAAWLFADAIERGDHLKDKTE